VRCKLLKIMFSAGTESVAQIPMSIFVIKSRGNLVEVEEAATGKHRTVLVPTMFWD